MSDIKILVACDGDEVAIPDNGLLYPIQVGSAGAKQRFEGMLHDDEGDSVSEKNASYCEMTALYWAWKNLEADYIGLFHCCRYLSFSEKQFASNYFGDVHFEANDLKTLEKIGLDESHMRSVIESHDIILPAKGSFVSKDSIRQQYYRSKHHRNGDLDIICQIIAERSPHMLPSLNKYLDGAEGYFCNMFIMRSDLFASYCEWVFPILEEHEKRSSFALSDEESLRVSSVLAERLLGVYVTYLLEVRPSLRVKELQRSFFQDVSKPRLLKPAFEGQRAVRLVFSANDWYVPYLSTLLQSIKDNTSEQRDYDIVVLHTDISDTNQATLKYQLDASNFCVRFFCVRTYMRDWQAKLPLHGHFRVETYFRLLLQDILPGWQKVLYLDADMVVLRDVAQLYDTDVDGFLLAAVQDADTAGLYNGYQPEKKHYMDNILKMKDPYSYFQAGTILFNLEEFRSRYTIDELFEYAMSYEWDLLDQDVLNHFAEGNVRYVPMDWNVMVDWCGVRIKEIISLAPKQLRDEYMEARKHPAVVHYAGSEKPWENFSSDFAPFFWEYARKTPYYEIILQRALALKQKPSIAERAKGKIMAKLRPPFEKVLPRNSKGREKFVHLYKKLRRWDDD